MLLCMWWESFFTYLCLHSKIHIPLLQQELDNINMTFFYCHKKRRLRFLFDKKLFHLQDHKKYLLNKRTLVNILVLAPAHWIRYSTTDKLPWRQVQIKAVYPFYKILTHYKRCKEENRCFTLLPHLDGWRRLLPPLVNTS